MNDYQMIHLAAERSHKFHEEARQHRLADLVRRHRVARTAVETKPPRLSLGFRWGRSSA